MGESVKPQQRETVEPMEVYLEEEEALLLLHQRLVTLQFPPTPEGCDNDREQAQPLPFSTEEGGVQIDFYCCFEMQIMLSLSTKDETPSKKLFRKYRSVCQKAGCSGCCGSM